MFLLSVIIIGSTACLSKGGKGKGKTLDDGQLHGAVPSSKKGMSKPLGMVFIPPGTFHIGPSDEDINFNYSSRNRQVSIPGFWMDATEITNNDYRAFVWWVRDSLLATKQTSIKLLAKDSTIDWNSISKTYSDVKNAKKINEGFGEARLTLAPDNKWSTKLEINPDSLQYLVKYIDFDEAAKRENANLPRSKFIVTYSQKIYPDTLVWKRDFSYSYNDPMTKKYFSHPAYGNYPVVGVTWKQAVAFCNWRTHKQNSFLDKNQMAIESDFRLPSEAEWEYAARGGLSNSMFPWGNYYARNKKGCLLANFKPGRGDYVEDGALYTVKVDAYWPNDYGLYNMAGNVAEWTNSLFDEGAYNVMSDMSPDIRYDAIRDSTASPLMKRKVVRGGSWKDVWYYLEVSTRTFEYQDTARSYIGFRTVIDLAPFSKKK